MGGPGGQAMGGQSIIHSEKQENHKNSTQTKIKFYIIFIYIFSFYYG